MPIIPPPAHSIGSSTWAQQITAAVVPSWWSGRLVSPLSHTSGRYLSVPLTTQYDGEVLAPTITGDCITGLSGVYSVSARLWFPTNSTGLREVILALNPSATTVNATTDLTYGRVVDKDTDDGVSGNDTALVIPPQTLRLTATDVLMVRAYQNSGATLSIPSDSARAWLQVRYVGE